MTFACHTRVTTTPTPTPTPTHSTTPTPPQPHNPDDPMITPQVPLDPGWIPVCAVCDAGLVGGAWGGSQSGPGLSTGSPPRSVLEVLDPSTVSKCNSTGPPSPSLPIPTHHSHSQAYTHPPPLYFTVTPRLPSPRLHTVGPLLL